MKINIIINNKTFVTNLENNRTAQAFYNLLPLTLNMFNHICIANKMVSLVY